MDIDDDKLKDLSSAAASLPPAPPAVQQEDDEIDDAAMHTTAREDGDNDNIHSGNNDGIGDNIGDDDDDDSSSNRIDDSTPAAVIPPPSKFKVFDKVIARDKDGLMYDAVIRRCLYGSGEPRQIPIGLFSNDEAEAILSKRREQEKNLAAAAAAAQDDQQYAATTAADSEPPAWYYFVHYNKWAVNWDRWVSQDDVYEPTEKIKAYAARIVQEHKDLSNQLASSKPGKKKRQTIDGNTFLGQWRLRLERIDAEMDMYNPLISPFSTTAKPKKQDKAHDDDNDDDTNGDKKSKKVKRGRQQQQLDSTTGAIDRWSKAILVAEVKNRNEYNLTNMRQASSVVAKKLVLPFALHKILVDQWEIISQCQMLPSLPAPVTVRQILNRYLASKTQVQQQPEQLQQPVADVVAPLDDEAVKTTATTNTANPDCSPTRNSTTSSGAKEGTSPSPSSAKIPPSSTENNAHESKAEEERKSDGVAAITATTASPSLMNEKDQTCSPKDGIDTSIKAKQDSTLVEQEDKKQKSSISKPLEDNPENSNSCSNDIPQEFIEMAEGIASFFDQALPTRLLYRQEIPQMRVLDAILPEECKEKRLSEIYGGEHLLRLFIRLPEALVDGFAAAAAAARSKNQNDTDDFKDPSPRILALLSDFARFLHKHQSTLFCQSHRKWTTAEIKEQQKMNALQQRRKRAAQQQQQQSPLPSSAKNTSTSKHDVDEGKVEAEYPKSQGGSKRRKTSPKNMK